MADSTETPTKSATTASEEDGMDQGVSMVDILHEEQQLELDANAVLGGSDDKNCTYGQGYVGRQALYSCITCGNGRETAGVCLACSLQCHEGHQLYELYTKRHFRCDCGNSKFSEMKCKLSPDKDNVNMKNRYNQNFLGLYCTCSRPYPDPEDDVEDEMIQCSVCEDWFHGRHLGTTFPPKQEFHEMICSDCMNKCDFLWAYLPQSNETCILNEDSDVKLEVESISEESLKKDISEGDVKDVKSKDLKESNSTQCLLEDLQKRDISQKDGSAFWPDGWRKKLCQCASCIELYSALGVVFLIDATDTVQHYEDKGLSQATSSHDNGLQALPSMDRVQLGEMIHGYNDMKESLREYLKTFAQNKRVVREEDIREFFGQMEAKKRRRLDGM